MSWWIKDQVSINEDGDESLCEIECDDATSLPAADQTATAGFTIVRGSSAKDIATGDKYIMGSTGTWVKQPSEFQLDLAGYATESWVENELTNYVQTTTYNTDQAAQDAEISYAITKGVKNVFNINATATQNHMVSTLTDDTLTVTSNGNWANYNVPVYLPAGDYIFTTTISNFSKDSSAGATSVRIRIAVNPSGGTALALETVTGNGPMTIPFTWTGGQFYVQFYPNYSATNTYVSSFTASNTMIRDHVVKSETYEPYAPTNRELYEMILALQ